MVNIKPQVQAVRPISKDRLDLPPITPSPTVNFNCLSNPATGEYFVLWDDIRLVFTDALYVRHEGTVVPFMRDAELMPYVPQLLLYSHAKVRRDITTCLQPS